MEITYEQSGVDTKREEHALGRLSEVIKTTWPHRTKGVGAVKLDIGFYANVIDIGGGMGLALSADGVGSKVLIAQMLNTYDTVGIDCVAMNVNDLICVGATPLSIVDYIAVQEPNPERVAELARGLAKGAKIAGVSISGGEIAQLPEIVTGIKDGYAFDLAAMATGLVKLDKMIVGQDVRDGDVVIGIESSGIHSNGFTLARRILAEEMEHAADSNLGTRLLTPTSIYVKEAMDLLAQRVPVKAFAHITSDGLLNLNRCQAEVGFVIDSLPPIPQIFNLLQGCGNVSDEEMFRVYNMGIGFCVVVDRKDIERTKRIIESHGKATHVIGYAVADKRRRINLTQYKLIGTDTSFERVA